MRRCALLLLLLILTGCQAAQESYVQPRSAVFDGDALLAMRSVALRENIIPWYAARNDQQPGVMAGFESPAVGSSYTQTYDVQGQSHGNVYDHYYKRTYNYKTQYTVQ